jgi:hypothetical protein
MRPRLWKGILAAVALVLAAVPLVVSAQGTPIPTLPVLYSGRVSIGGEPAPDGLLIFARILSYETAPVAVEDGYYRMLQVVPTGTGYSGKEVVFYATYGFGDVQALETSVYWLNSSVVSGKHRGSNDAGNLMDTYNNFEASGVRVGYKLFNYTDGSSCYITSVAQHTLGCNLTGGVENKWDTNDQYNVDANTPWLDLHFDHAPSPPPTPTPTPTPTVPPTPTMTPTPTPALPIPGDPAVGTLAVWVLVAGALALVGGLVVLRLARARRS